MGKTKKYYAVAVGKTRGIYTAWFGLRGAEIQVRGVAGAVFKGFPSLAEAEQFLTENSGKKRSARKAVRKPRTPARSAPRPPKMISPRNGGVVIHTDGGCMHNPGPGGYGVVITEGGTTRELSGGYRLTTNNRMELMACIVGLGAFETPVAVTLYTDSRYVANGITKGWAAKWKQNGWVKSDKKPALNPDLWEKLLGLCEKHDVEFVWVKGHAGNAGNERCDLLATEAMAMPDLPPDKNYQNG